METVRVGWLGRAGVILGGLALLLAIATVMQGMMNRGLQQQVATGQAQLARAQALANLDKSLVELMAKSAVENQDAALTDLLARNGVTFNASAPAAPPIGVATASGGGASDAQ